MAAAAVGALHLPGPSRLHHLAPHTKTVGALLLVVAIATTPREAWWAFAVHAALLAVLARAGRIPARVLLRRLVVGVPVLVTAALLPFVAEGDRVQLLGPVSVSGDGLWAAWNVAVKAMLGLTTTLVLVATTSLPDLVRGLERLRVPAVFTAIATFMLRYVEVVVGELARMRVARISRGHDPRWIWQARAVAASGGALFVRCFERGERVHLAMVSRGFDGTLGPPPRAAASAEWGVALAVPALAAAVSSLAWMTL